MTSKALRKLESLKMSSNLKVIPVTTRSVAQFKRVNPMQNCEFAITSNGGTIQFASLISDISMNEKRNKQIIDVLKKIDGSTIVLSDRVEQLKYS